MRICLLALCALGAGGPSQAAGPRPNILLITADTFRPDHLGYYGYGRNTSPVLDSLSAEGVFFRQAFTTSGWTAPGLLSIHTSLYAPSHGVDIRGRSIDPSVTTLAEALREVGYRAPDIFFLTDIPNFQHLGLDPYARRSAYVRDGDEILFRWLEEEAEASDAPFFLYYHYRDLHQPYAPGPEYAEPYLRQAFGHPLNPLSWVGRFLAGEKLDLVRREMMLSRGIIDFAPWDRDWVAALYDGQVRRMDEGLFGRLRRILSARGLAEDTIVIVSADHGEELLERGLIGHASTYKEGRLVDEIIRIPLIFWAPGRLPAGAVLEDVVQCIDVMPTLLEMVGAPVPPGVQGRSLLPLIEGSYLSPRPAYFETSGGGYTADVEQYGRRTRALRTARWKLVWRTPENAVELFDLAADPGEIDDVAGRLPNVADSLQTLLAAWVESHPRVAARPAEPTVATPPPSAGALQILFPVHGDTLRYAGANQTIQLRWSGHEQGAFTIEYEIGAGAYHLEGLLEVESNTPSYGPYHADFWNSLVLYNPWRFRVYPRGQVAAASDWATFSLSGTGDGAGYLTGRFWLLVASATRVAGEVGDLGLGLLPALADLGAWLSRIPAADVTAWALLAAIAGALLWPRLQRFGEGRVLAWGLVVAYVAFVYATVPVFPDVWARLREYTGAGIGHSGTLLVLGMAAGVSVRVWRRARVQRRPLRIIVLVGVLALYGWLLDAFGRFPGERLHLLEYGLMAFLIHRALRIDRSPASAYPVALGLTTAIGCGDETIQWVLPQRFFELKDVGLNVVAGALGLVLTGLATGSGDPEDRS